MATIKMEGCSFKGVVRDVPTYPECPFALKEQTKFVRCCHPDSRFEFCSTNHMFPKHGECKYDSERADGT